MKTLQFLWALHVSGDLNEETLLRMLDDPASGVRRWAVRLLGDPKQASAAAAERLIKLSRDEADITVRCQLAATAKRLPDIGLLIFGGLLSRDADLVDPQLSLMLWWVLESQAISPYCEAIVNWHASQSIYKRPGSSN